MARFAVRRSPGTVPRRRLSTSVAALAVTVLMVLSSCASLGETLSRLGQDDPGAQDKVVGWSLFHAAADQWQMAFALTKRGAPWMHEISLVEQLRPGAKAPLYQGELPVNTIIAPATPTEVGLAGKYGWRTAPDLGIEELHNGADIAAAEGSDVKSAMEGVVRAVFWDVWGGNRVEVAHTGDMVSTYNHLQTVLVEQGDKLEASQKLGTVGQTGSRVTGPHLHFETWVDGEAVDPQSFDWIVGDEVIPAPHDRARNPQVIPRGGRGDNSSIDATKVCPHEDPGLCGPPDKLPKPAWPDLSSVACISTAPGIFDCMPFAPVLGTAPGPEDCPALQAAGARTDCPTAPPTLTDLEQCRTVDQRSYDCVPFAPAVGLVAGAEDCPTVQAAQARTDCPAPWPDLSSAACVSSAPGIFDCAPVPGAVPGAEDCPAAEVEGARTDCPTAPPTLADPLQCRTVDQQTYDCVPFAPAVGLVPGAEDCPTVQAPEARTDCPAPLPDLNSQSCVATAPGIFDCMPLAPAPPGPEDCPPAPVEGARTDCPAAPPTLTDPLQCRTVDRLTYDCVPFAPAPPGPEDCPATPVEGARADCPAAPADPSEPSEGSPTPPNDGVVVPSLGTEAALLERRPERRPGTRPGRRPRRSSAVTTSARRAEP